MTRTHSRRAAVLLLALVATSIAVTPRSSGHLLARSQREVREHHVTASVLGKNDVPIPGLTPKDLVVREDNLAREIVKVSPAPPPTHLVLLVDDSQATESLTIELRAALKSFVEQMHSDGANPATRLATFGERPNTRVEFTTTLSLVAAGIDRIAPRTGSGSMFLEALIETARDLRTRRAERPVIVAFVDEQGPELSTDSHTNVTGALKAAGAALWTLVLQDSRGQGQSDPARERSQVLGETTSQSGGLNKTVLSRQGLQPGFLTLASALKARYDIVYGRPDSLVPPTRLDVQARDRSLRVLTAKWIGQ